MTHVDGSDEIPSERTGSRISGPLIAIFLAIFTAAIGYAVTLIGDYRKRQVEFADLQIEKLYGPLLSSSVATRRAWEELHKHFRDGQIYYFDDKAPPTPEQVEIWRRWMKAVFLPLDIKMETAIIDNAQLIDGGHLYPVFQDLIAHVESYKATIAKWRETDAKENPNFLKTSENTAVLDYPTTLDSCIAQRFELVRARRELLENSWNPFLSKTSDDSGLPADCR